MDKEMQMEIQTLNSEKRMYELANKGYQNMIAEQLNGSLGDDIKKAFNDSLWNRFLRKLDNILKMF